MKWLGKLRIWPKLERHDATTCPCPVCWDIRLCKVAGISHGLPPLIGSKFYPG